MVSYTKGKGDGMTSEIGSAAENQAIGAVQGGLQGDKLEVKTSHSITLGRQAFVLLALLVAAGVVCMVFVVKQARLAEVTALRLDVIEMNAKVTDGQVKGASEAQRLTAMAENHNKLVQAASQVFTAQESKMTTLEAKVTALEAKVVLLEGAKTNVSVKVEAPEKKDSGKGFWK